MWTGPQTSNKGNFLPYIVWVKIVDFSFMPKLIRVLSKDHVPWRYFVHFRGRPIIGLADYRRRY